MVLKANDEVLYGKYSGTEIELDGEKYIIMRPERRARCNSRIIQIQFYLVTKNTSYHGKKI